MSALAIQALCSSMKEGLQCSPMKAQAFVQLSPGPPGTQALREGALALVTSGWRAGPRLLGGAAKHQSYAIVPAPMPPA